MRPACGGLVVPQVNPYSRLMYQPSVSIFMCCCAQASGDDSDIIVRFKWRAVKPNISLRSPVSTVLMVIVTTPPRRTPPPLVAGGIVPPPPSLEDESSVSIGVIMYLRARSLT